jgi:hypothetical protein
LNKIVFQNNNKTGVNAGTMYLLQLAMECTMRINIPVIKYLQIGDENYNTGYGTDVLNISKYIRKK